MDIELTPRAVFSITKDRVTQRTLDLTDILGTNTVKSHTMTIYDSSDVDVTSNFGKSSSEASGIITFGIKGHATGTYTIKFVVTCDQTAPDGTTDLVFTADLILEVTDTPTSTDAATAEQVASYALVSLSELKIAVQIALDTTTYDTALVQMINDVTDDIEKECEGRRFKSASYTSERYSGTGQKELFLRNFPITAVSSVTIDGETVNAASDYNDYSKYWIEPIIDGHKLYGVLYREDKWDRGDQNVVVSYTGGYTAIPGRLRRAAMLACKSLYNLYRNTEGKKSESIGKYSYSIDMLDTKIQDKIDDLIAPFKVWSYV